MRFLDPVGLSTLFTRVPPDELEAIEDYWSVIAAGLPYERATGELEVVGPAARGVAARIALVIRAYRDHGTSMFEPLCELAERVDAEQTEATLKRLEDEWQQE